MVITVRPDFKSLIPPLAVDEYEQLEQNCIDEGIRDPLVLWGDVLIDGHNRYEIAQIHNLPYKTVQHDFSDDSEAKAWIIKNQIGRRNLSAYDRCVLALKMKPGIQAKAKERMLKGKADPKQKSAEARDELAKIAGVSHDTMHKAETIEREASEETKQQLREGKLSINQAYNSVREKPKDGVAKAFEEHREFQKKKADKILDMKDIQNESMNAKIITDKMVEDVLKMFTVIDRLNDEYQSELPNIGESLEDDERQILSARCSYCQTVLEQINSYIGGIK